MQNPDRGVLPHLSLAGSALTLALFHMIRARDECGCVKDDDPNPCGFAIVAAEIGDLLERIQTDIDARQKIMFLEGPSPSDPTN